MLVTKLLGMGRGLAATPAPRRCPPEPFPGCAGPPAASQPLPVTPPAPPCWAPCRAVRVLSWPHLTLHFCKRSAKPCPLEKCSSIPPPTPKTSPPLGPGCPLPFVREGRGVGRGLTLGGVLSSHMEFRRPSEVKSIHMEGPAAPRVSQLSP